MDFRCAVYADPGERGLLIGTPTLETLHPFPLRLDTHGRIWLLASFRPWPAYPISAAYISPFDIFPTPTLGQFLALLDPDPPTSDPVTSDRALLPI